LSTLYQALLVIHVFSAIFGVGSLFILSAVIRYAKDMKQLKFSFVIFNKIHVYAVVGTMLLLFSGLGMAFIQPYLFKMIWVQISLALIVIFFIIGPIWLRPIMKPILDFVRSYDGEEIPDEFHRLYKKMVPVEIAISVIFIMIILLMVLKP
jgi:uncharacterized membrane protein